MTTHELAKRLLKLPDITVVAGTEDELAEVKEAKAEAMIHDGDKTVGNDTYCPFDGTCPPKDCVQVVKLY